LGYKLADNQRALTPLQRLFLLYGYAYHRSRASEEFEKEETRPLSDLVHILPKGG